MISKYLGIDSDYIIIGLAAICLILLVLVIINMVQTSKLNKKYQAFMKGKNAKSLEETQRKLKTSNDAYERLRKVYNIILPVAIGLGVLVLVLVILIYFLIT